MTVPTTTTTPVLEPAPVDQTGCAACPHPLTEHDPIGLRFCRATSSGTVSRGCVCRSA
ncbi:hypothetical protein SAMN05661080_01435 [Modestobacter sp. DSM 44400]|uniref:RGCVC family protein n=1 Tax=Modestobacter sp. DSM 44400 TaxID=1550230 RepID=UPI00089D0C68|nr:RGCVC family protein [Modestobacter sp. DSM 44400]SDX84537.1 hypothetical protein SAMN05661080_01435 [Modestobacter sp. DSM 44400]